MPPSADELQTQIDKITFEIVNTADASQKQILKDKYSELQESRDKLRYDDDFEIETDEETEQDRILRQQRKLSRSYDFVRKSERKRTPVSVVYRISPRQMTKRRKSKTPAPVFSSQKRMKKTPAPVFSSQKRTKKTPAPVFSQQKRSPKTPAPVFSQQKRATPRSRGKSR